MATREGNLRARTRARAAAMKSFDPLFSLEQLEARQLLAFSALINFQPQGVQTPSGYRADTGAAFGSRGGGLSYGWNATNSNAIDRNSSWSPDQRYDTFAQMQVGGSFTWELVVPNGTYNVRLFSGDPVSNNAFYHVFAEGRQMVSAAPSDAQRWIGANFPVNVTDGRLTITSGPDAQNNKFNFIEVTTAAPTMPGALTATVLSATQVRLNWQDNAINETGYRVERQTYPSNVWQTVGTLAANATTFTDTTASPSTRYAYQVRALNEVGSSQPSFAATVTTPSVPALAPTAPSNLAGTQIAENAVTLTWHDNSSNEEKFVVEKVNHTGEFVGFKEVGANTTSTNVFVGTNQIHQFRVVASNTAGGNSEASNTFSVIVRPAAPVYPSAQARSSSSIELSWDSLDACVFRVQRMVGSDWVTIADYLAALSLIDTGLPAGTAQSYRILAIDVTGVSDPSDVVTASTAPAAVTGLTVTAVTDERVSLRWDDVAGEAGYMVERSLDGVTWTLATLTFANVTTHTATGLQAGTTYRFRVTGFAYGSVPGERGEVVLATTLGGTTEDERFRMTVLT
jgi:fibronectin type 3 domain-containing protein